MVEIICFPKENIESLTYNIDDITIIYDIKKFLSEKTKNNTAQIFIYDFKNPTIHYENYIKITTNKYYYKRFTYKL